MNQPVKKSALSPAPKTNSSRRWKLTTVFAVPLAAAASLHLALGYILDHGLPGNWWVVGFGVTMFALTLAAVGLAAAVTRGPLCQWLLPLGVGGTAIFAGLAWQVGVGGVVEAAAMLMLILHVRHEEAGRIRFSVVKLLTYGLTLTITLMLLAVALFAYAGFSRNDSADSLQQSIIDSTLRALNTSLPLAVKNYVPEMTVDELIGQQLPDTTELVQGLRRGAFTQSEREEFETKLRADGIDPSAVDLDRLFSAKPEQREALFREIDIKIDETKRAAIDAARERIADSFKISISGNERVDAAMRKIVTQYVERFTRPNQRLVPPLLAVSLFLTLALFAGVYTWLTWLAGITLFAIYRKSKIVTMVEEDVRAIRYEVV